MQPKISVIVPFFNAEEYLEKCLTSLVNQTLKDIEIVLINDGSIDNSEKIVEKYLKKYSDKIIYRKKVNEGQGIARNDGIKLSTGEFVSFVDSDDYIDLTMFEKLYNKALEEQSDIVATTGFIEITNGIAIDKKYKFNDDNPLVRYILNNSGPVAKIIKRDIILKNNLFFPKLRAYEDIAIVPLWGIYAKKISYVEESLYHYLIHSGSTMKQIKYNKKLIDIFESLEQLYNKFTIQKKDKYKDELEWIYIEHLLHAATLRFLKFDKISEIKKINSIVKKRFPKWYKNKYYKRQSIKYKIVCMLIYKQHFKLLKLLVH